MRRRRIFWRIFRFLFLGLIAGFLLLVIVRIPVVGREQSSRSVVAAIHAQKITLAEVMGRNLPPLPDPQIINATIAGTDANRNGIRDDVELAIFRLHPDEARIRAAELQYALALQDELTKVFDSSTLVAASQEADRAYYCLSDAVQKPLLNSGWAAHDARVDALQKEIDDLQFNTAARKQAKESIFERFMASHGDMPGPDCDVDLGSLPN